MEPAKVIYTIKKNEKGVLILESEENNHYKEIWKKVD